MKLIASAGLALTFFAPLAGAALQGNATLTPTSLGGGQWRYDITINNTGDTTIGTLWFAWIPGQNYMTSAPTAVTSPAGWTPQAFTVSGGTSQRWQAAAASRLAAGQSLTGFSITSAMSPAAMSANSIQFPGTPIPTSFFYIGNAFGDPGFQFIATVVPAPSGAALALLGGSAMLRRRR